MAASSSSEPDAPKPAAVEGDHERLFLVIRQIVFLGLPVHVILAPTFFYFGLYALSALNVVSIGVWVAGNRANNLGKHDTAIALLVGEVVVHSTLVSLALGWDYGFQYYLFGAIPFVMFNTNLQARTVALFAGGLTLLFVGLFFAAPARGLTLISDAVVLGVYAGNAMVAFAAVGMNSLYFRQGSIAAEEKYMAQRDRADSLLLNVLPPSVADRLKHEPDHTIADRYENVTVLFADLVGFTPASALMEPEEMVVLLNDLFSNFDRICDECGAEKIKTIGDGYMAICGAPIRRQDHAQVMADVALKIRDHVADRSDRLPIQIRLGLNSGEVVGAIVGSSRFHYDVFSDTVNVAARMESTGIPGRVHMTRATAVLLAGEYDFEERGKIQVKGKGEMETYFLRGRKGTDYRRTA
ncbi:MAG: adenylate/guanylate cyclase domain-containing protein [Deltaproteobacteria bacterium]|nr:adenylate/guanylate cyclase domain-containing protein [Deltaproteobacteria bacterium]